MKLNLLLEVRRRSVSVQHKFPLNYSLSKISVACIDDSMQIDLDKLIINYLFNMHFLFSSFVLGSQVHH